MFNNYIYNVTALVESAIAEQWIKWLNEVHVPEMLQTGCFYKAVICKLEGVDEAEGITYAIQYYAESMGQYDRYIDCFADGMRNKGFELWGNKTIAYRSILQILQIVN